MLNGEVLGYYGKTKVGSLDYSEGTILTDGSVRRAMRLRGEQSMSIKTPMLFVAEDSLAVSPVTKCTSTDVTVLTGVAGDSYTTKTLRFINGLCVTG